MISKPPQNRPWKHLSFITIQIILVSISNGTQVKETIMSFIDNRGFPGGPVAWFDSNYLETSSGIGNLFGALPFCTQNASLVGEHHAIIVSLVTVFLDVSLLHRLRIKSLLSHCSCYSILGICMCVVSYPKIDLVLTL